MVIISGIVAKHVASPSSHLSSNSIAVVAQGAAALPLCTWVAQRCSCGQIDGGGGASQLGGSWAVAARVVDNGGGQATRFQTTIWISSSSMAT